MLIDKTNIQDQTNRANDKIKWMEENAFHPSFLKVANEYATLTVKINAYIVNNRLINEQK